MKIATWNIERLKHRNKLPQIVSVIEKIDADILILTETDERIQLKNYPFQISTSVLPTKDYASTERRVKIYSKFQIIGQVETFDNATSCCVELETAFGNLIVYGTIIGIFGNRNPNFKNDLLLQIADWERFSTNSNLCIAGDFNISFSDNYYFTDFGRTTLLNFFQQKNILLQTTVFPQTIDHIAISASFLKNHSTKTSEWNFDEPKQLSDHKGICAELI